MRERPILFNAEMVKAILDWRKTCTRRAIKFSNGMTGRPIGKVGDSSNPLGVMYPGGIKRPPYQLGDILYVRETWSEWTDGYLYKAWTEPFPQPGQFPGIKWKPSIHMPKAAARIWLKVTDVRVERLQNITEAGAINEGCIDDIEYAKGKSARNHFIGLWNSTIKKSDLDKYGWSANPWVWVIEFERCEKPGKE